MTTVTPPAASVASSNERAFAFVSTNDRPPKPRRIGITEIRGPYYTAMGPRYLEDVLETMGVYVDALKFAGGSFSLMPRAAVSRLIEICHAHHVLVSTGGFIEYVLGQGAKAVDAYLREARELGFDFIELSSGFITIPFDDWLRLVQKVKRIGLKAKPEIGIQFGAGGASAQGDLEAEGTADPEWLVHRGQRFLDAGADLLMIESEGITYIKNYGPDVNLFVDHSQIVQLECLRSGIWGTNSLWGRIKTFKETGRVPSAPDQE